MPTTVKAQKFLPYLLSDMFDPRGSNELSSREGFIERKMYKNVPYFSGLPRPLRSWYDKLYFGRVDTIQNGVVVKPDTSNLKQIKTETGNIFVLNFVADAFEDLNRHLYAVGNAGLIRSDSVYYKLNPINGILDYNPSLTDIIKGWEVRFATRLNSRRQLTNRVVDLKSYISELFSYLESDVNSMPLTLTGYVMSNYSSPMISGLSLELQTNNYGEDAVKFTKYITDPNFTYFVKAARKFGFYVDRNGPWKITADPLSSPMLDYMNHYISVSPTFPALSFFNHYYNKTYINDLDRLKTTLRLMYNKYAVDFPRITISTTSSVACPQGAQEEVRFRSVASAAYANSLGDLYWLDVYFKIRLKEAKLTMTDYKSKYRTAVEILKTYNMERALRYINNEIKPYLYNLSLGEKPLTRNLQPVRIGSVRDTQARKTSAATTSTTTSAPSTTGGTSGTGGGGSTY